MDNIELRDFLAVQAPPGATVGVTTALVAELLGRPITRIRVNEYNTVDSPDDWDLARCILRYRWADTMLKARTYRGEK